MVNQKNSLEQIGEELARLADSGIPVIVEGPKDASALRLLGINNIFELSKQPIFVLAEQIAVYHKRAAILTDLDKKGKILYGKLHRSLIRQGVQTDNRFRQFLLRYTKISHIEGLATYLKHIQANGKRTTHPKS